MCNVGFWLNVLSTTIGAGLGAAIGAYTAFQLERGRRQEEEHRDEIGRCNQLICLLVNRLNVLQDFHDDLFLKFEEEHKRPPTWNEVGTFIGAPRRADDIPFGDYKFLIDGRAHETEAPALLRRVQMSTINTNALFDRIAHRNELWRELKIEEPQAQLQIGPDSVPARLRVIALERGLEEITPWVRQDLEEEIATLLEIIDLFYRVMHQHYPKEKVLTFKPIKGGQPLGHSGGAGPPPNS